MISRRTTLALADVYTHKFHKSSHDSTRGYSYRVVEKDFYDFLFACNYPAWFCNLAEKTYSHGSEFSKATRTLKEFVMKLHTGESMAGATPQWTWQQRERLGQQFLVSMSSDILNKWNNEWKNEPEYSKPKIEHQLAILQKNLELDGYVYDGSHLLVPESDILDTREETGVLYTLFTTLNLGNQETIFHHLKLSEEHYLT